MSYPCDCDYSSCCPHTPVHGRCDAHLLQFLGAPWRPEPLACLKLTSGPRFLQHSLQWKGTRDQKAGEEKGHVQAVPLSVHVAPSLPSSSHCRQGFLYFHGSC